MLNRLFILLIGIALVGCSSNKEQVTKLDYLAKDLDSVPTEIFEHKHVKVLHLRMNNIEEIPEEIKILQKLEEISIGDNPIKDMELTLERLSELPNLKELDLENTGLTTLPDNITKLKKLETLFLWGNPIDSIEKVRICKLIPNVEIL